MSFSSRTIVCEEVFDENSAPLEEEVKEYACRIGIDPDSEPHLLHYAREGLMQALPAQWKPCFDKNVQAWYYFNSATRQSQWEHPLDGVYRSLVKKARSESISSAGEDDSKTSAKEELKSYEEPADPSVDATSRTMDSSKSMSLRKANIQLNPLKKFSPTEPASRRGRLPGDDASAPAPPRVDLTVSTAALFEAELRPKKEIPSPTARIDIDKMTVVDAGARRDKLQSAQEKHPRGMTGRGELTLTGGGSIFLKSRDRPEPQSPGQAPAPTPAEEGDGQPSIEVVCSQDGGDMPKGILRDQKSAPARPLWDVDPHLMSAEEKQMWRRQELEEERKSVRFNLDKALDIHFTVSESDRSDRSDQEAADEVGDEDWISDDEDLAQGRATSGARAAVPVRDASDGSDRDEMSPKIIDSIFPSDDQVDTQMSRERSGKERAGSLFHKVGGVVGSKGAGKLSELYFPKEGLKSKVALNMFDEASRLSDESAEDRGREGSDSGVGRLTYEDTPGGEGGDPGAKAGADGLRDEPLTPQCAGKDPNQDLDDVAEALLSQKEKMARELSESLKQLEMEHEGRREAARSALALSEQQDKQQLLAQMEQRLALFRSSVQTQQEARETGLREKMEAACESVRAELATDHQRQMERLRSEYEQRLGQERAALQEQLAEMERELASRRDALDRELAELATDHQRQMERLRSEYEQRLGQERAALQEQLAEMERELASRRDALDRELAELEAVSAEQLRAASRRLEEESARRLAEARGELEAARQARLQELSAALAADLEAKRAELAAAHQQELEGLRASHEAAERGLREEHVVSLETLRCQLHQEEEGMRRELEEQRARLVRELEAERARGRTTELIDNQPDQVDNCRMFEKLRCEKRLLEDKYRSLKEKYIRLKTDVKISIERRKKRDGGATTGSETDRSTSHKTGRSSEAERLGCDKRAKKLSPDGLALIDNNNGAQHATGADDRQPTIAPEPKNLHGQLSPEAPAGDSDNKSSTSSNYEVTPPRSRGSGDGNANNRRRRQLFGRPRPCSAATRPGITNNSNNANNNDGGSVDDLEEGYSPLLSPVENLRRQLQKLEDLEDQFPASTHTDTYLRYPFTDTGQFGSSEMEFFRHRIHLERDSVRRAKDFLRVQRGNFLSRQRELKERGGTPARNMLDRLYQEEKELTDMEVSLHRTRGLLGEKIIRLRHLEQSLYRAAEQACPGQRGSEDLTLSDLSSHSGSSGFSSTELGTDADRVPLPREDHYQESSEIVQSLENLNSEIREIWEVLHKQQEGASVKPVVTCGDLAWPTLLVAAPTLSERVSALRQQAQQNLAAMGRFPPAPRPATDPALAERARSLRQWLRHARLDSAQL
ncbi:uncharacterized protein LOC134539391 isoform X2 [Bacillus rossius redtenbacheri]|uniref:uncharacterized protein LOC134539391 isoform X2 n=1 Tax=Bacillus rossius redtenbacheri TaxID=93214 RepID=UPI002FDE5E1D